jgi:MYXO-CTERM domain-containing protein
MKRLLLALALVALALPASAAAGGWATVQLSSTPAGTKAGDPWTPELTVLQHGRTALEDVTPVIRIMGGGVAEQFAAQPTGEPGRYRAEVVFPEEGTWRWEIWDGFSRTHTYAPVTIAPGGGQASFPTGPVTGAVVAALGLAGLAFVAMRRRRPAPRPALDA